MPWDTERHDYTCDPQKHDGNPKKDSLMKVDRLQSVRHERPNIANRVYCKGAEQDARKVYGCYTPHWEVRGHIEDGQ